MTITCLNCGGLTSHMNGCKGDPETITIPRDLHELYKEAAEEWAKDWRRPTQLLRTVRCKSCLSATRIDELSTYHSAMVVHAADCKAARILGLEREG